MSRSHTQFTTLRVHLLYSSIVWFAAWLFDIYSGWQRYHEALDLVGNGAQFYSAAGRGVRHPLGAAYLLGPPPLSAIGQAGVAISGNEPVEGVLCAVWLIGAIIMLARLCVRIATERRSARATVGEGNLCSEAQFSLLTAYR